MDDGQPLPLSAPATGVPTPASPGHPLPVWAVQVDRTCLAQARRRPFPPFLRHVLQEADVKAARVQLALIFPLTDVPSPMGPSFPVSQSTQAAVGECTRQLRNQDLDLVVRRMEKFWKASARKPQVPECETDAAEADVGAENKEHGNLRARRGIVSEDAQQEQQQQQGGNAGLVVKALVLVDDRPEVALCRGVADLGAVCLVLCSPSESLRRHCFAQVQRRSPGCHVMALQKHRLVRLLYESADLELASSGSRGTSWASGLRRNIPFTVATLDALMHCLQSLLGSSRGSHGGSPPRVAWSASRPGVSALDGVVGMAVAGMLLYSLGVRPAL